MTNPQWQGTKEASSKWCGAEVHWRVGFMLNFERPCGFAGLSQMIVCSVCTFDSFVCHSRKLFFHIGFNWPDVGSGIVGLVVQSGGLRTQSVCLRRRCAPETPTPAIVSSSGIQAGAGQSCLHHCTYTWRGDATSAYSCIHATITPTVWQFEDHTELASLVVGLELYGVN